MTAEYSVFQGHATVTCCYKGLAWFPGWQLSSWRFKIRKHHRVMGICHKQNRLWICLMLSTYAQWIFEEGTFKECCLGFCSSFLNLLTLLKWSKKKSEIILSVNWTILQTEVLDFWLSWTHLHKKGLVVHYHNPPLDGNALWCLHEYGMKSSEKKKPHTVPCEPTVSASICTFSVSDSEW